MLKYLSQMLGICMNVNLWERLCFQNECKYIYKKKQLYKICFFVIPIFIHLWLLKKKLQDILRRTFNLISTMALSMQKCKKRVVPRRGNENHFLATSSWFTLWPTRASIKNTGHATRNS